MESATEKLKAVLEHETSAAKHDSGKWSDLSSFVSDMKKAGIIKQPNYNLPLVDTIGKSYYSRINKIDK